MLHIRRTGLKQLLLLGTMLIALVISCGPETIQSTWRQTEMPTDGTSAKWNNLIAYQTDEFGIGVANDEKYLYLCLISDDRTVSSQVMRYGLTLWLSTKSSKGRLLGIHFPVGNTQMEGAFYHNHGKQGDSAIAKARLEESLQSLEVIGPTIKDSLFMKAVVAQSFGLFVKLAVSIPNLVYELRIPLHPDSLDKYAIDPGKEPYVKMMLEGGAPPVEPEQHHDYAGSDEGFGGHGGGEGGGSGGFGSHGSGGMGGSGHHGGAGGEHMSHGPEVTPLGLAVTIKLAEKL